MRRTVLFCAVFVGGLVLSLPTLVIGQQYKDYGSLGRFVVPKSTPRAIPRPRSYTPPRTYKYESRNWSVGGYSKYTYKYKSGDRTYKGTMETFPSGAVRHKGRWR